ncbi:hypothetical protein [Streptomyces panaciradicis]|uniref:hypothetical protein n=1 Tax=Streptomyces panaciradicis TaxID=1470261 RepID=UPI00201D16BC|nr:hypothetical protein [Streptomyces panaciradicis]MCL6667865.1 hypothetical protein [Streptomyces panaciradicis]
MRAAGALGHLLLVVVLALSVFLMHTVGHQADASSAVMNTASHAPAAAMGDAAAAHAAAVTRVDAHGAADPAQASSAHMPLKHMQFTHMHYTHMPVMQMPFMAMDMLTLCLAVLLGAWVLAALLRSALARHPDRPAHLLSRALAQLWPAPPPPGPDLTRLSVLRL